MKLSVISDYSDWMWVYTNSNDSLRTCKPENMGATFWAKNEPPNKGELDANKFCSQLVVNDERYPLNENWQSTNCEAFNGYTGWICTPKV